MMTIVNLVEGKTPLLALLGMLLAPTLDGFRWLKGLQKSIDY